MEFKESKYNYDNVIEVRDQSEVASRRFMAGDFSWLFVALGVVSALAGMMFTSQLGTVRYDLGLGGELQMVLMAMLGGTYIFGGRGSILGTFLAAWLLSIMTNAMNTASWLPATQFCLLGVLLIVSIIVTNFIYSRTQR